MAADNTQTEGLKMISDWCKWIVTIETGAIALIGALITKGGAPLGNSARYGLISSVTFFIVSIVFACGILSALPASFVDIKPGEHVWDRGIYVGRIHLWTLSTAAYFLSGFFILGILAFSFGVIRQLLKGA
jgi:hypothetical protein